MITTQTNVPLHHRGMLEVIDAFDRDNEDYASQMVGRVISTTQLYEEIGWWSGLGPAADILEAEGVPIDTGTNPFNKKFYLGIKAIGFEVSDVAMETEQFSKYRQWSEMFAQSHYVAEQQECADIVNYMTSTDAKRLGIDGKPLVATDHPTKTSSWSNRLTDDKHLGPLTLGEQMNNMMDQQAYRDYPFPQPGPFDLICGTPNADLSDRLTQSRLLPGGSDNDKNTSGARIRRVIVNPFQTQKYYWVLKAAKGKQGLFKLQRKGVRLREQFEIRTNSWVMTATKVFSYGWSMPNGIAGSAAVLV